MSSWEVLFFYYMTEGTLVCFVGAGLVGIRFNLKQIVTAGILQGLLIWVIRGVYAIYNIPLGTHSFFILAAITFVIFIVTREKIRYCFIGAIVGLLLIFIGEGLLIPLYKSLNLAAILQNQWIHIALGWAGDWLLLLGALFLVITKKSLFNLKKANL